MVRISNAGLADLGVREGTLNEAIPEMVKKLAVDQGREEPFRLQNNICKGYEEGESSEKLKGWSARKSRERDRMKLECGAEALCVM